MTFREMCFWLLLASTPGVVMMLLLTEMGIEDGLLGWLALALILAVQTIVGIIATPPAEMAQP